MSRPRDPGAAADQTTDQAAHSDVAQTGPPAPATVPIWRDPVILRATRWSAVVAWTVAFSAQCYYDGVPFDREGLLLWISLGAAAATIGKRNLLLVVIDFLPFAFVLIAYDYLRGASTKIGMPTWWHPQLDVDKFLFGGVEPTVWLQEHFERPTPQWWDVAVTVTYCSFFFLPYLTAGVLWIRSRAEFYRWARRFVSLSFLGFIFFALIPAAPPWAAASCSAAQVANHPSNPSCMSYGDQLYTGHGLIGALQHPHPGVRPFVWRLSTFGFDKLHLSIAHTVLAQGQDLVDQVAAVPSLHAGGTLLFVIFFWSRSRLWVKPLLVGYAVFMAIALVYSGEHYVSDVLAGWLCAALVHLAWNRYERRRSRSAPVDSLEPTEPADPPTSIQMEKPCPPTQPLPETTPSST